MRTFGTRYQLNKKSPLTTGLLVASLLTDGGTDMIYNAARTGFMGTITTTPTAVYWKSGPEGIGYYSKGQDFIVYGTNPIFSPAPNPLTAIVRCEVASLTSAKSNFGKVWGAWLNPQVSPFQNWGIFQQGGVVGVSMGNANGPIDLYLEALPVGSVHTIAQTFDGTTLSGYVDGVFCASTVISPTTGMQTGQLAVGGNTGNFNEFWQAPVYEVLLWGRCLSASEIATHARDPYRSIFTASSPPGEAFSIPPSVFNPAIVGNVTTFTVSGGNAQASYTVTLSQATSAGSQLVLISNSFVESTAYFDINSASSNPTTNNNDTSSPESFGGNPYVAANNGSVYAILEVLRFPVVTAGSTNVTVRYGNAGDVTAGQTFLEIIVFELTHMSATQPDATNNSITSGTQSIGVTTHAGTGDIYLASWNSPSGTAPNAGWTTVTGTLCYYQNQASNATVTFTTSAGTNPYTSALIAYSAGTTPVVAAIPPLIIGRHDDILATPFEGHMLIRL